MPIYDYYCGHCNGQFSHLARRIDEAAPACPRCGCRDVERLVTTANLIHGADHHSDQLRAEAAQVDGDDVQATARFLKASGRLADSSGLYGSRAYQELIDRRAEGATDRDLTDLVDELATAAQASEAAQMASAMALADDVDARMQAEGPHDHEDDVQIQGDEAPRASGDSSHSHRSADNLGWG